MSQVEIAEGKAIYDGRTLAEWAPDVARLIVERCAATRVVLFGSVVQGTDGPDSDIDLLVVLPIAGRRHDAAVAVMNELRSLPVPVDVVVVDSSDLVRQASEPGLVRAALREGRELVAT